MEILEIIFWLCSACVLYTYAGYAAVLAVAAKVRKRPLKKQAGFITSVSFVTAAHNEASRIGVRVNELTALVASSGVTGEVIVVSDGSTDSTAEEARRAGGDHVRVIELLERGGKASALNAGCAAAQHEILVFTDTRQRWDAGALRMLLENFADATVGAVSGDLVLQSQSGVMAGVGLYWRYEKWLRKKESHLHSTVGVTGAICSVRRSLFPGVPQGIILDDVYWPLAVTMQGYRVVHEKRAVAYDRLPERTFDEFRRKVRTLAGNFQLVARMPTALLPWRNPIWLQFVSHKLLRLVVPWALLVLLVLSAILPGGVYETLFWSQVVFYSLALAGNVRSVGQRLPASAAAASVVVLNAAAWLAFWVWLSGRAGQSWSKATYKTAPVGYSVIEP
jgi:cellulose synthase/poly-beta-1,6-N-acetylglucosamine synthase-like glycosyltransferase